MCYALITCDISEKQPWPCTWNYFLEHCPVVHIWPQLRKLAEKPQCFFCVKVTHNLIQPWHFPLNPSHLNPPPIPDSFNRQRCSYWRYVFLSPPHNYLCSTLPFYINQGFLPSSDVRVVFHKWCYCWTVLNLFLLKKFF